MAAPMLVERFGQLKLKSEQPSSKTAPNPDEYSILMTLAEV